MKVGESERGLTAENYYLGWVNFGRRWWVNFQSRLTKCSGSIIYLLKNIREGKFKCDDGRFGNFTLSSGGDGFGIGKLNDGEEFVLHLGQTMTGSCTSCHLKSPVFNDWLSGMDSFQNRLK